MSRTLKFMAVVALVLLLRPFVASAVSEMPSAYQMAASCAWKPKPWARLIGAYDRPVENVANNTVLWGCRHARGEKSRSPFVNTILQVWPSASQRRTWEMTDEDRDSLPAQGGRAALVR